MEHSQSASVKGSGGVSRGCQVQHRETPSSFFAFSYEYVQSMYPHAYVDTTDSREMVMHSKVQKLFVFAAAVAFVGALFANAVSAQAFSDSSRPVQAKLGSSSTKGNSAAHAEYKKIIDSLAKNLENKYRDRACYYYADVYGDSTDEALIAIKSERGSGWQLFIYTYEEGEARSILSTGFYGDDGYCFYKSTKSFSASYSGHGGMHDDFYTYQGNSYRLVARASRSGASKGGDDNTAWSYSDGKNDIPRSSFDEITQGLTKGEIVRVPSSSEWEYVPVK